MELLLSHQTQFVHFYSLIHRKTDVMILMKSLQLLIVSLRKTIMTEKNPAIQKSHFVILKLLFKLICYTRDIYGGLGERELTYCMLFIWKYHFPLPTAHCLRIMVNPISVATTPDTLLPSYGSWRDIKGFCGFIRKHSEKGEGDPFIETCIGLLNHQLDTDMNLWKKEKISPSLVCRWIPRETSSRKWLFDRCAIQWIRAFRPHYLQTVGDSGVRFQKAMNKGKKEYRQIFTSLSKVTETLQIKQCSNQWNTIDPKHIPMRAMSTQQHALLNICSKGTVRTKTVDSKDRLACAEKICAWGVLKTKRPVFLEMGTIIKQSLSVSHPFEIDRMECLWSSILDQIPDMPCMIPFLDLSMFHTDIESFYNALGMALAIVCKSKRRLVAFDTTAHFISFSGNLKLGQMMDIMKPIFHEHHIGSDLCNAFSMCSQAMAESKLDETLVEQLMFVVFSNNKVLDAKGKSPSILYWGEQVGDKHSFPFFVGYTNNTLTRIAHLPSDSWKQMTPFLFIQYLLSHERYDQMDTYFDSILKTEER